MKTTAITILLAGAAATGAPAQQAPAAPADAPSTPAAPAAYENVEILPANKLIGASLRQGPGYVVEDPVATDGYFGIYRLRTEYGIYECHGKEMLAVRIDELRAIRELEQVNKGEAFLKAAGAAVAKPLEATARIVRDPAGSLGKVPQGVAGLFKRAGQGMQAAGAAVAKGAENVRRELDGEAPAPAGPPKREDPFGFNKNRNQWAAQVRVDPYSTNPVLAEKLTEISAVTFTTNLVAGIGVGMVAAPLAWAGRVDEFVLTQPPAKIREKVTADLTALGCLPGSIDGLTENPAFSPTLQLRFAATLGKLSGAANLNAAVELAAAAADEVQARFLCASLEALAARKSGPDAFKSLIAIAPLPAAVTADGGLLVVAAVDVLPWIATTDAFSQRSREFPKRVLVLPTQTTQLARTNLAAHGWNLDWQSPKP